MHGRPDTSLSHACVNEPRRIRWSVRAECLPGAMMMEMAIMDGGWLASVR